MQIEGESIAKFAVNDPLAYTDQKFDAEKVQSSDSIMKLSKTPSRNVLVGQKQRFLCYFSEVFLSNGVVWSVEMFNGSKIFYDSSCKVFHFILYLILIIRRHKDGGETKV